MASIKKNMLSLVAVQAINYTYPLLSFSIIANALGVNILGLLVFSQAIIAYIQMTVDFGFNLSATRKIASNKDDQNAINKVYTETIVAKVGIAFISIVAFILLTFLVERFRDVSLIVIIYWVGVLFSIFYPVWLFQGIERMENILLFNTISKIVSLILLFVLVKNESDIYFAALTQTIAWICVACLSLYVIKKKEYAKIVSINYYDVIQAIQESKYIFFSSLSTTFYSTFNIILLGFLGSDAAVAIYSLADKIRILVQAFIGAITQALYPRYCQYYAEKKVNLLNKYHGVNVGFIFFLIGFVAMVSVIILAPFGVDLISNNQFYAAIDVVRTIAILFPIVAFAAYTVNLRIIASGNHKALLKIYGVGAIAHLSYAWLFINIWGVIGLAISVIITESIMTTLLYNKRKKLDV